MHTMNLSLMSKRCLIAGLGSAALMLSSVPAMAAEPALIQGPIAAISKADIEADSLRMPPEMRSIVLAKPQTVTQVASNLYTRRVMANQAESEGLAKSPEVLAALQVARDKVLSDAYLAKIDEKSIPNDAAVESLARNIYKARPERFKSAEQLHARHILIAGNDAAARAQAEKVLEDIKGGADFAKLAEEKSADKGSAAKGGDLGFFEADKMVPQFAAAAGELKKAGDLSGVVESQFGFHIIKLEGRRPAGTKPYAEVRDELIKEVRANLQQESRIAEAKKLQQGAAINSQAIDAFAAGYVASAAAVPAGAVAPAAKPVP